MRGIAAGTPKAGLTVDDRYVSGSRVGVVWTVWCRVDDIHAFGLEPAWRHVGYPRRWGRETLAHEAGPDKQRFLQIGRILPRPCTPRI